MEKNEFESKYEEPTSLESALEDWNSLSKVDRLSTFESLNRTDSDELFLSLNSHDQGEVFQQFATPTRRSLIRLLAPDDAADLIQELDESERSEALDLLDVRTKREVAALLAYKEDQAGGLMNPRFARIRPDMTVVSALEYLRMQARDQVETIRYLYILDFDQKLHGVVSLRQLFAADPSTLITDLAEKDIISVAEDLDQEEVGRLFSQYDLMAIPVLDHESRMKGIVTLDDIVNVVQEEATEDIQKFGAQEALENPYLRTGYLEMFRKRFSWLVLLFLGSTLTATAMSAFEHQIKAIIALTIFIPLIISSGGNSGSQAATLIVRAIALGELRLQDWWRVLLREFVVGLSLGLGLGVLGYLRIAFWPGSEALYSSLYFDVALTVGISVVGVVLWGSLVGAMLPFILRMLKLDPATASAPMVSTLVDVVGIMIYFLVATIIFAI